ncbi:MAG: hypothetical protein SNJ63_04160 [Sphingomonadaceae bacterium]
MVAYLAVGRFFADIRRVRLGDFLPAILAVAGLGAAAAPPPLAMFASGFPAGAYDVHTGRGQASTRICLKDPAPMLFAHESPGETCRVTVVRNDPDRATVTWSCQGGDSGRTDIRRDHAALFVVHTQGITGKLPYSSIAQYRHVGPCR